MGCTINTKYNNKIEAMHLVSWVHDNSDCIVHGKKKQEKCLFPTTRMIQR